MSWTYTHSHAEKPRVFGDYLQDLSFCNQRHASSLILDLFFKIIASKPLIKWLRHLYIELTIVSQFEISPGDMKENECFDHEPTQQGLNVAHLPLTMTKPSRHDKTCLNPSIYSMALQ